MAGYRKDVQGLRAIAVLGVLVFHAKLPLVGGYWGVDVFFVVSGFVIGLSLFKQLLQRTFKLRIFYRKRFFRLAPSLGLMVAIVSFLSVFLVSPFGISELTGKTGIGSGLLIANIVIARNSQGYFTPSAELNPLLHVWSLSIEEQFYLLIPIILLIIVSIINLLRAKSYTTSIITISTFIVTLTLSSLAFSLFASHPNSWAVSNFFSPIARTWEFGLGMLTALYAISSDRRYSRTTSLVIGLLGIIMIISSFVLINEEFAFPSIWSFLPTFGAVFVILSGTNQNTLLQKILSSKTFNWVGDRSYSFYLWHWPFVIFALALFPFENSVFVSTMGVIISLPLSLLAYKLVELKFKQYSFKTNFKQKVFVALVALLPIVFGGTLLFGSDHGYGVQKIITTQKELSEWHLGNNNGCVWLTDATQIPQACQFNLSSEGKPIYLLGNSQADHFSEGMLIASELLSRPFITSTTNVCPFSPASMIGEGYECEKWNTETIEFLSKTKNGTVIVSNSTGWWNEFGVERYKSDMEELAKTLLGFGHEVTFVTQVPLLSESLEPQKCPTIYYLINSCDLGPSKQIISEEFRAKLFELKSEMLEVNILDTWKFFCSSEGCNSHKDGKYLLRDTNHLTVKTSKDMSFFFRFADFPN